MFDNGLSDIRQLGDEGKIGVDVEASLKYMFNLSSGLQKAGKDLQAYTDFANCTDRNLPNKWGIVSLEFWPIDELSTGAPNQNLKWTTPAHNTGISCRYTDAKLKLK